MKNKTVWMGFVAVYIVLAACESVINMVLLKSDWQSIASLMRPEAEMKVWVYFVSYLFLAYSFSWIFSKGYEAKGIMEGVRYGLAVAFMLVLPWSYGMYASMPVPYSLTLKLFLYGTVEMVIAGVVVAWVFGMKPKASA
jgi:hypothetical protein